MQTNFISRIPVICAVKQKREHDVFRLQSSVTAGIYNFDAECTHVSLNSEVTKDTFKGDEKILIIKLRLSFQRRK